MKNTIFILFILMSFQNWAQPYTFHRDLKSLPEWISNKDFEKKYNLKALEYNRSETKLGEVPGFQMVKFEMRTRNTELGTTKIEYFLGSADKNNFISQTSELSSNTYKSDEVPIHDTWFIASQNLILNKKVSLADISQNNADTTYSYYMVKNTGHIVFLGSTMVRPYTDEADSDSIPLAQTLLEIDMLESGTDQYLGKMTKTMKNMGKDSLLTVYNNNTDTRKIICTIGKNEKIELYFDKNSLRLVKHELNTSSKQTGKYYFMNEKMVLFLKNDAKDPIDVIAPEYQEEEIKYLKISAHFFQFLSNN